MKNLYSYASDKVENGARFRISFENRSFWLNGKNIIKDGICREGFELPKPELQILTPVWKTTLNTIEALYHRYRYSIPSERSELRRKTYFLALPEQELSDDDMLYGAPREAAQLRLELFILISILNGSLVWDDFAKGKWFWKSSAESGLIILKKWVTHNN